MSLHKHKREREKERERESKDLCWRWGWGGGRKGEGKRKKTWYSLAGQLSSLHYQSVNLDLVFLIPQPTLHHVHVPYHYIPLQ